MNLKILCKLQKNIERNSNCISLILCLTNVCEIHLTFKMKSNFWKWPSFSKWILTPRLKNIIIKSLTKKKAWYLKQLVNKSSFLIHHHLLLIPNQLMAIMALIPKMLFRMMVHCSNCHPNTLFKRKFQNNFLTFLDMKCLK